MTDSPHTETLATPPRERRSSICSVGFGLFVFLAGATPFLPSLQNGFVNWDDSVSIEQNIHLRRLDADSLWWTFTNFHMGPYEPLSWLSLAIDYAIWGPDPRGFHLTALLIHATSAVSCYFLSRRLLWLAQPEASQRPLTLCAAAALSAVCFALHPLRVEPVAWASDRLDVMAGPFAIWSVIAYLRAVVNGPTGRANRWLAVSLGCFAASMLSKPAAMGLPLVLTLLDFYPLRRVRGGPAEWLRPATRRVWLEKAAYWLVVAPIAILAVHGRQAAGALSPFGSLGLLDRLVVAGFGTVFYVTKTLLPIHLSPLYELPETRDLWTASYVGPALLGLGVSLLVVRLRRSCPWLLVVWASYLLLLAPASGLAQTGSQIVADRYSYLPCMSFAVLIGGLALQWAASSAGRGTPTRPIWGLALLLAAAVGLLGGLTWQQTKIWHDTERLWRHVLAVDPQSSTALASLGLELANLGREQDGLELLERAVQRRPTNAMAHNHIASVLRRLDRVDEAKDHYLKAWQLAPKSSPVCFNLGLLYHTEGDREQAVQWYERALRLSPDYLRPIGNLAQVYVELGRLDRAAALYQRAAQLEPNDADFHSLAASLLRRLGRHTEALAHYQQALRIDPRSAEVCFNIGLLFQDQGQWQAAEEWYARALVLQRDHGQAIFNLAIVNKRLGRLDRAIELYRHAINLNGANLDARYNLAIALAEQGGEAADETAAVQYRYVLKIEPAHVGAANNLALLLERRGEFREAAELLRAALAQAPEHRVLLFHLSSLLATAPADDARNGTEAVTLAERLSALTGGSQPQALDALAAAYAEAGQFDRARETAARAADIAQQQGNSELASQLKQRLALYRSEQPFRTATPGR